MCNYCLCLTLVKISNLAQHARWPAGVTSSGKPSEYLWKATLKIVGRKSCESKYGNYTKITSNMFCAIGKINY